MAIQQKRSATPGAVPTAFDLVAGEIAINTADGLAYIKKDNGAIVGLDAPMVITAADLAITVDTVAMYSTVSSVLGVVPSLQVILPAAAFTLVNSTATQAVFDIPNDTITLSAATSYMFDGLYLLATGTTSHFTSMSFVLTTATITNITWFVLGTAGNGAGSQATSQTTTFYNSSAGGQVIGSSTNSHTLIKFQGVLRVDVGGTMVPNIKFSAAPGVTCSTLVGSYFKIYPVGFNTISSVGSQIG